jgi:hypothetical protein
VALGKKFDDGGETSSKEKSYVNRTIAQHEKREAKKPPVILQAGKGKKKGK